LSHELFNITSSEEFSGIIRIALLPNLIQEMRLFLTSSVLVILLVAMLFLEDHFVLSINGKRKVQVICYC
jgi:hypothetical protein